MGLHEERSACRTFADHGGTGRQGCCPMPSGVDGFTTKNHERPDDAWSFDLDSFDSNFRPTGCRKLAARVRQPITPCSGEPRERNLGTWTPVQVLNAEKLDRERTTLPENLGVLCPPGTRAFRELFLRL